MDAGCVEIDNAFGPHAGACRGGFDFTLFFEETVLTLPLISLLLLAVPFRLWYLFRRTVKVERSTLILWKLLALSLFTATQIAGLVLWLNPTTVRTKASIPTAILSFVSSLSLIILSYAEHVYAVCPSTIINLFLFFSTLLDAARARTLWLQPHNQNVASVMVTATALKIAILSLEACEKRRILKPEYADYPPEATSGILSRFIFSWQLPLFKIGYSKALEVGDLYALDKHLKTRRLNETIKAAWRKSPKDGSYSLFKVVLLTLKWPLLSIIFPRLCYIGFTFAQPFLISTTIEWSEGPQGSSDDYNGYGLIGAFCLVYVGIAISMGQHQHLTFRAITMARGQLISMLYEKATDLSATAVDPAASLTLMSADIERIDNGWRTMHEIWANLLEIGVAIFLLERQLGVACLIPVAAALGSIMCSVIVVSLVMARQALWLEAIERRVAVTSAMLGSMKGVKMCGLTNHLLKQIQDMRMEELAISEGFRKLLIWNMGLAFAAPVMAPVLTFLTYSLLAQNREDGSTLDNTRVFTSLSLFALLQEPLSSFIMSLNTFVGSIGCFVRIQSFLQSDARQDCRTKLIEGSEWSRSEDKEDKPSDKDSTVPSSGSSTLGSCVVVKDGSFGWEKDNAPVLSDINVNIPAGKFTVIVGPVGCGKSTFLKAVLGEVSLLGGSIQVPATDIAYCDQTAWHMNGTIRSSIIAFSPEDERWYQLVLRACALEQDLRQWPKGDNTVIGSKGVSLSGGQSQRIALARAMYAQKEIVVLDDVFSGLDSHTENTVFHNLLGVDGVLRRLNTTVIVASSHVKRLPYADHIICLDREGHVVEQGTFEELETTGGEVSKMNIANANWAYTRQNSFLAKSPLSSKLQSTESLPKQIAAVEEPEDTQSEISRRTGDVQVYLYYARAIGWIPVIIFVLAICAYIFCQSFPTIWVNWWAAANARRPNERLGYYLGIYAMLGVLALVFLCISCWQLIVTMVPLSGKAFHWSLLKTVMDSPMSFFSETDSGITINRFSQDLQLIDMDLPIAALNTFATFVLCIAQMILIGVGSNYAAVSFPFLLAALYLIQRIYLRTSRQLRFLDLEAKSPLYSQFTETLAGLATLRAFGWKDALECMHYRLLDQSQRPFYLLYAVQRWLTLVLDMFVAGLAVLLIIIIVELRGILSPGLIGVALTNVILFSQNLKLLLTFWTTLETHIGAISRIKSFTTHAVSEHLPEETETPPSNWPSKGSITFENVYAGYKSDQAVLKNLSITIEAGQKVAICGRTGSGKSSMVATLFRMAHLQGGKVIVDGVDISTLPREEIRSRLIGVPQDTFLLEGSVRINADPTGSQPDGAIVNALERVHMWDTINSKGGLDTVIGKLHLSHGQRQLFCLARAMLRPSPILVLDEATSSIDSQTDNLLQRTMREKFASHTVIAIVHKLESILDYDKVALLENGELLEYDSPHALLSRPGSAFSGLYKSLVTERIELPLSSSSSSKLASESSTSSGAKKP